MDECRVAAQPRAAELRGAAGHRGARAAARPSGSAWVEVAPLLWRAQKPAAACTARRSRGARRREPDSGVGVARGRSVDGALVGCRVLCVFASLPHGADGTARRAGYRIRSRAEGLSSYGETRPHSCTRLCHAKLYRLVPSGRLSCDCLCGTINKLDLRLPSERFVYCTCSQSTHVV